MRYGRFAQEDTRKHGEKLKEFTFLGFTHYCGKTKEGYFKVKRKTSRKKLGLSLSRFSDWARKSRGMLTTQEMFERARSRVVGHLNYYAITDNLERCSYYVYSATRILFKWLNRRSQRKSYTWDGFNEVLALLNWPHARVCKNLNPCRRAEVY
jgi:hypothetical protein